MKKILMTLILGILLISLISAACTITLDKYQYYGGETATATMSCSLGSEKNKAYTVTWYNGTQVIETDSGTTPNVVSQAFFETLNIPLGLNWTHGNASLTVNSVIEDSDTFVANDTGSSSSLIVKNITFTSSSELFIGRVLGIRAIIEDENGKKISNANCQFDIEDGTGLPITALTDRSHDGIAQTDFILEIDSFDEGRQYIARVGCFCGSTGTDNACVDEDGGEITTSVGSATNIFKTLNWLTVNSVTSLSGSVGVSDEFSICANVTNNLTNDRLDIRVYYNWRCGSGSNSDTDRIVYGYYSQLRGISANTTQMQCHDFVVPNEEHIEKGSNICYAATDVSVLNEEGKSLVTYTTTSPQFNVTTYSIHPPIEFQRVSKNIYFTNVSFNDFDVDVKNVHAIIDGDLNGGDTSLTSIKNYTITYFNGSAIPYNTRIFFHEHAIRFQENLIRKNAIEIEIADVNTTLDENFNLTITFENYEERQTEALEGINNKTGTFHLDVDCPSTGIIGNDMDCTITAYIEDTQLVQKEVDFTCYISDGTSRYSSINFNQMITRNAISITRSFAVPSSFISGQQYVLQCHADYYNIGSRRDSFYDTFMASTTWGGGPSGITGGVIEGEEGEKEEKEKEEREKEIKEIIEKFNPFSPNRNWAFMFIEGAILIGIIIWIIICITKRKKKKAPRHKTKKKSHSKIFKKILLVLAGIIILIGIIAGIVFIISYLSNPPGVSEPISAVPENYSIIQDKLFRGIILTTFIILVVIILSKALNIRGEIKFGRESIFKKYDKKMKEQRKLNKEMLRRELKSIKKKR